MVENKNKNKVYIFIYVHTLGHLVGIFLKKIIIIIIN